VQNGRQFAGLQISDRILLTFDGDDGLLAAARTHEAYIAAETLATKVAFEPLESEPVVIDDRPLQIGIALAG
jgi:isoleucyl-tRNA synthetase